MPRSIDDCNPPMLREQSFRGAPPEPGTFARPQADGATDVAVLPDPAADPLAATEPGDALFAIVLAGGIGSRFWPLSSPSRPKQLLPLVDDRPLIADTIRRFRSIIPPERVIVMTSADIASAIHAAIPEVPAENMLAEPAPMGTAASIAWGVAEVKRRAGANALVCVTHADLAISFLELFHDSLLHAAEGARRTNAMILLGVAPTRSDTSFGYVLPGRSSRPLAPLIPGEVTFVERELSVRRFAEKPDEADATALIDAGAMWYSGIFVSRVATVDKELRSHTPEVATMLGLDNADRIAAIAGQVASISVERGLFERSSLLRLLPVDFNWDDVGTWASLRRARDLDDDGNGTVGAAHLVDSTANIVHTESGAGATVLYGVDNLLVVRLGGLTFVTTLDRARDLRPLLEQLPPELRRRIQD